MTGSMTGLVIGSAHGIFDVALEEETLRCTLRGKLRKPHFQPEHAVAASGRKGFSKFLRLSKTILPHQNTPDRGASRATAVADPPEEEAPPLRICVGDLVRVTRIDAKNGVIEEALPRRSKMSRGSSETGNEQIMLANLDQAIIVLAVREPEPHFGLLDRYLAIAEHNQITPILCLNKMDLGCPKEVMEAAKLYARLGYRVLGTSTITGEGLDTLKDILGEKTSLLTGPSGVGKTSLLNALEPGFSQRIGAISEATGKGRHTTTSVRLFPLSFGGWLADSAGIRELALWSIPAEGLASCFIEMRPYLGKCEFEDCTHAENEEGCAIRRARKQGKIRVARYRSYLQLRQEAEEDEKTLARG
ncbi:MAG TPA: ribosome small subunit-dependent GTPase A [Ktedonobacterales bacterium]|jgi:ribosome biogenesis GTPase